MEAPSGLRDGKLVLITPFNTLILTSRPTLMWEPYVRPGFTLADYLVTVRDANGDPVWETSTPGCFVDYPASAPVLKPGDKYTWSATPRQSESNGAPEADENAASRKGSFQIVSPAEAKALQGELDQLQPDLKLLPEPTRRVAVAAVLSSHRANGAAIEALMPELNRDLLIRGEYDKTRSELFRKMDEESRILLRSLYLDTKQNDRVRQLDQRAGTLSPDRK
jgi:hypothetical protein